MKLSDKELHYALFCGDRYGQNPLYAAAMADLEDGTLEIEGYVRADHIADDSKKVEEWIRFDPNDPKTFPPKDEYFDVFISSITHKTREVNKLNEFWWKEVVERWVFEVRFRGIVIYWRPLPKPPVESEV